MRSIEDYKKYGDFVRDLVDDTKKIVHAERRAMAESLNHIFLITLVIFSRKTPHLDTVLRQDPR
jgi:hypothetical protein